MRRGLKSEAFLIRTPDGPPFWGLDASIRVFWSLISAASLHRISCDGPVGKDHRGGKYW